MRRRKGPVVVTARRGVVVSTPRTRFEQGEVYGNPHERHLSTWKRRDFSYWRGAQFFPKGSQMLVCIPGAEMRQNEPMAVQELKSRRLWSVRRAWWRFSDWVRVQLGN